MCLLILYSPCVSVCISEVVQKFQPLWSDFSKERLHLKIGTLEYAMILGQVAQGVKA